MFALNLDAMAPLVLSFSSDIYFADPAVSALTFPIKLFRFINFEAWLSACA